ncbi:DNA-binding protein [Burkholderia gladioli]|uniref:DNA-binding protein n=1 Tax=Burkholderia gladioli TaxID=28095 RepID=UPI00163F8558|nr:DNA-binding protein [Burkholderia gladioli]MBJ9673346.1 DNA-binding protein [Burkholderia gladioli]MBU9382080.1 DNA-binding protein [Burkholderia gladioli]MDN7460194.1 DNA-binding protein [Burkholderia gladioli]
MARPNIEQALRAVLTGPERKRAAELIGWDASEVSRFLSGQRGVLIGEIDKAIDAAGYALVSRPYLDAVATLCKVGAACECARQGAGECGID